MAEADSRGFFKNSRVWIFSLKKSKAVEGAKEENKDKDKNVDKK